MNTFERKEIKFLVNSEQYNGLIQEIPKYMTPDIYCKDGNEYGVYNIYYDTEDDFLIRKSLDKPYYKEKFRLRSYFLPVNYDDSIFLEIKKKVGSVVTKRRITLTYEQALDYLHNRTRPVNKSSYITNQIFSEFDNFLSRHEIFPKQYISYQRLAFLGDNNFRITFDSEILGSRDELFFDMPYAGSRILDGGMRIMEVKVNTTIPSWLLKYLSELKIYKTSYSKYGNAYTAYIRNKILTNRSGYVNV